MLAGQSAEVLRELYKAIHELNRQQHKTGLNPAELRERLDKLNELRVIQEDGADIGSE